MMTRQKISVIVPCFNHGEFLGEAVRSVRGCGRKDLELVIVDDGSTEQRTVEEIARLADQGIAVVRQNNKGLSAARNAGIRASCGELILPLDADDRLRDGWLDGALRIFAGRPRAGVVYGDAQFFGTLTQRWCAGPFDADRLLAWNYILATSIFRRDVWEKNGGFDETMLKGFEDWEFWVGALENGWEFVYVPEIFFDYRKTEQSMLTRAGESKHELADFIAKKHALLYREALLRHETERLSIKRAVQHLGSLVVGRAKRKCSLQ